MEVTFQEVRAHLGLDGQRQWNDQAIGRTTPSILGLFSLVTLAAHRIQANSGSTGQLVRTAWYKKELPTFSDALAWTRNRLWREQNFWTSIQDLHRMKTMPSLFHHMEDLMSRAA